MGKKNLDSILIKEEKVLPSKADESLLKDKPAKKKVVKKKKELESEVVSIKITPSELALIKEKAGELVPTSTFVKHFLRTKTDLFAKQK